MPLKSEEDLQQGGIRRRTYPTLTPPACSDVPYSVRHPSTVPAIPPDTHLPIPLFQASPLYSGTNTVYPNAASASHVAATPQWRSQDIQHGISNPAAGHLRLPGTYVPIVPNTANLTPLLSVSDNHGRSMLPSVRNALVQAPGHSSQKPLFNGRGFPACTASPVVGLQAGTGIVDVNSGAPVPMKKDDVLVTSTTPVDASDNGKQQNKHQLTDDVKKSKEHESAKKKRKVEKPPTPITINQDEHGKLNKKIVFPDSQTPLSLRMYKKKSKAHHQETSKSLREIGRLERSHPDLPMTDFKWTRKVDQVEEEFWTAMRRGVNGKPVTVAYGVDVEAEGAFDTHVMSYVEWRGDEKGVQKRKKGSSKKDGLVPRSKKLALPKSHVGTLNRDGLLRHLPRMPGINHSMYYVGQLFTRFCWHIEDAFLNSVSYLHEGNAEKIWYAVPPEDATLFEQYAAAHVFSKDMLTEDETGQLLLMNKTTIFDPVDVRNAGITVYRVVHRPGSFVLTAPRAYHAGFNCGFNIAEAVNFANPNWFPVGREASNFARSSMIPLCVPWEYLLFHEAKALYRNVGNKKVLHALHEMTIRHARIVAGELGVIITEGERAITAYAKKSNCRVALITDIDELVKNNQLGPQFGNGAGMVCALCTHACHFYAEMCASCTGSFEARCPKHFGEGHQLCLEQNHKRLLVRRHDPVLLLDILCRLEEVAGIKLSATVVAERYRSYIRPWQTPLVSSGLVLRMDLKAAVSRAPPKMLKDKGTKEKSSRRSKAKKRPSLELDDDVEILHVKKERRPPSEVIDILEESPPPHPRSKRKQSGRKEARLRRRESLAPHPDDGELYVYEERNDMRAAHRSRSHSRNRPQEARDHGMITNRIQRSINEHEDYLYVPPRSGSDERCYQRQGYRKM